MRRSILFTLFHSLLIWVANAERKLPADLQVDIIFPRNETYAPTQWFPIIFGIQNLDAVWPLNFFLSVTVWSLEWRRGDKQSAYWQYERLHLNSEDIANATGPPPSKHFFHIPSINMTNGTTDQYVILWDIEISNQCFANNTNPLLDTEGHNWSNRPELPYDRVLQFGTAPGAQLPDIEATVNSCLNPNVNNSAAVRISQVRKTVESLRPCPVLETNITSTRCGYKPLAAELAANVSAIMLGRMRCDEGTWQTITAPCPRKSIANAHGIYFGVGWVLILSLAAAVNIL